MPQWLFVVIFIYLFSGHSSAWEGHYMLSYAALGDWPGLSKKAIISPESLKSFVEAEKNSLIQVLKDYEQWAEKNIQAYPALPKNLVFDGSDTKKFLMSLRINPELSYTNFVLYAPKMPHRIHREFSAEEKSEYLIASLVKNLRAEENVVEKVINEDKLSALEILASASEEPDHGLDFGLWEDNNSSYGKLMGLGMQPFGNPVVSFSSQAPFHMGFYFEKKLLYWAASWLKRCYPEYRISQFITLARHAFATGHSYWGYRFLGWALHYIQDLTQPYHADLAPGSSWLKLIGLNSLEIMGIKKPAQDMRQLLTNKHLALENYQFESIRNLSSNNLLNQVLTDSQADKNYPPFTFDYARKIVAQEARSRANHTDMLIKLAFPSGYVKDPEYIFSGTDSSINLRDRAFSHDPQSAQKLEFDFLNLMRSYGSHTRNTIKALIAEDLN